MNYTNRDLELTGDGSRTPRLMEYVWALTALSLFVAWLESSDVSNQVIAEKVTRSFVSKQELERCERYAKAITQLLNSGGTLSVDGATYVSCRAPKHIPEAS